VLQIPPLTTAGLLLDDPKGAQAQCPAGWLKRRPNERERIRMLRLMMPQPPAEAGAMLMLMDAWLLG